MIDPKRNIRLLDTTLRDGEQAPGVAFSADTKMEILKSLYEAGIRDFEIGTPAIGFQEQKAIAAMLAVDLPGASRSVWCRARIEDLKIAYSLGAEMVNLSLPVSTVQMKAIGKDEAWVIDQLHTCLKFASTHFSTIVMGAQDASRAEKSFLKKYIAIANSYSKVIRIRIADTVGILNPFTTHALISDLANEFPRLEFEFHGHNDLGMGNANGLAAIVAGADLVSGTINGLGERCGNTPIEELLIALEYSEGLKLDIDKKALQVISNYVAVESKRAIHESKPFNGEMCFTHESGIHTRSLLVDEKTYQPFNPEDLGVQKRFVFGKHSGSAAVKAVLQSRNLRSDDAILEILMQEIKSIEKQTQKGISEKEVIQMYHLHFSKPANAEKQIAKNILNKPIYNKKH